jgi:predicted ATPase/class 3 adenylate cyclase
MTSRGKQLTLVSCGFNSNDAPDADQSRGRLVSADRRARAGRPRLPEGTITFFFTDIEGSTKLWERRRGAMGSALARHDALLRQCIGEHSGHIIKTSGDGFYAVFATAPDALHAAIAVQWAIQSEQWPANSIIRIRAAIHSGTAELRDGDYYGPAVNRAARVLKFAHGGQTLLTQAACDLCADALPPDASLKRLGQYALKDLARPEVIFQLCHPDLREEFPEAPPLLEKTEPATRADVGAEPPVLYGRSEDLATLCDLVRGYTLVTVVGPGGIGKTRLAQAVAHELRNEFADGVRLVELAPITNPDIVAITVARALGVAVGDPNAALDVTVRASADQRLLLILDNCEHLLDAVEGLVAAFRKRAPSVHVLTTSQELLRGADEHVYRLGTLGLPAEVTTMQAREAGAVQLFVARVQAADSRFQLNETNVAAVVDICRRLDGIPLAMELAAARVPLLGVEGVRERLDERFRLLTAGSRLALRRHQTLRAALEWSYGLLSEAEQSVLDRLGVFAGSFSLESAQELASDDAIDSWAVLDHLGTLVDKSLVIVDAGATPRYRMLETTRAFALERLAARGETLPMLRRHAEVTLTLFERFYRDIVAGGASPGELLKGLGADLDNLRGAIHWASGPGGDLRTAIALVGSSGAGRGFLTNAGLQWEGWQWCKALQPRIDASIPTVDAARFWLACAEQGTTASIDTSAQDAQRAIALYREAQDQLGEFFASHALLYSLTLAGRFEDARGALVETKRLLDPSWPPRPRAGYENMAGLYFESAGQPEEARDHLVAFLDLARQMRSDSTELIALGLLADLDVETGHPDRAIELLREPLSRLRASTPEYGDGMSVRNYATALMESGHFDDAESAFRDALPQVRRAYGTAAFVLHDAAWLLARRGRIDDAARVSAYAESVYAAMGRKPRRVALRNQERLRELISSQFSTEAIVQMRAEGRALTDDQACMLAFPPLTKAN